MNKESLNKYDKVITANEIKNEYKSIGKNPLSANYLINKLVSDLTLTKIQNGLYLKTNETLNKDELKLLFKDSNENEFLILDNELLNKFNITNSILNQYTIFVYSTFYNNNLKLFEFIESQELATINIISSKFKQANPTLHELSIIHALEFTVTEDPEYLENAKTLIKQINPTKLEKGFSILGTTPSSRANIMEIYYGK